ncbi:MAG: hypothetical protein LBR53_09715 [Deltaproteobacteria bacterium]|jgi:hypothetical protein|nr:hypothetical protein [Deltaproteobacteria bacterium]
MSSENEIMEKIENILNRNISKLFLKAKTLGAGFSNLYFRGSHGALVFYLGYSNFQISLIFTHPFLNGCGGN